MEQLLCEAALPGVVVFGRVQSFPWWPGIVGRCPQTNEWKDRRDRRWVFFFNDCNGAWLKIRDMRPFTQWTKEAMGELNKKNARFPRYREQIAGAVVLAEEYMRAPEIPRPLNEYSATLTFEGIDAMPPENPYWLRFPVGAPGPPVAPATPAGGSGKRARRNGANGRAKSKRRKGEMGVGSSTEDEGTSDEEDEDIAAKSPILLTLTVDARGDFKNIAEWKAAQTEKVSKQGTVVANGGSPARKKKDGKKTMANGTAKNLISPSSANAPAPASITAPATASPSSRAPKRARTPDPTPAPVAPQSPPASPAAPPSSATPALPAGAPTRSALISVLVSRMASLEGHVQSLRVRAGDDGAGGEGGEDRVAAALKTRVRGLARVADGFARSRLHEQGAVRASIQHMWGPPVGGGESAGEMQRRELLKRIARAVVGASEGM